MLRKTGHASVNAEPNQASGVEEAEMNKLLCPPLGEKDRYPLGTRG